MRKKLLLQSATVLFFLFVCRVSFASGSGSIMGRVIDKDTKTAAADVIVVLECQGSQLSFVTNDSGYYYASNIPTGVYNVTVSFMDNRSTVTGVRLGDGEQKIIDLTLSTAIDEPVIICWEYKVPIIDPLQIDQHQLSRDDFKNEPVTKVDEITATQPGVVEVNGVFYVHGAREGSLAYYVDGGPVMNANIPLCGLETYTIYTGYIPAKYGDTVGGVVVLETRNFYAENR